VLTELPTSKTSAAAAVHGIPPVGLPKKKNPNQIRVIRLTSSIRAPPKPHPGVANIAKLPELLRKG
jgi:hypothetical protein